MAITGGTSHENWLRTSLCEDLADMDRRAGRVPDTRTIETVIDEDIRKWAAMNREAKPAPPRQKVERDPSACLPGAQAVADRRAERNAKTKGMRVAHGGPVEDEPLAAPPCQCGFTCKQCRMWARLKTLLGSVPLGERKHVGPEMWLNTQYPAFARDIMRVWQAVQQAPGLSPKRQQQMSKADLNRWALRQLENICDRSNALPGLGSWWVK